MIQLKHLLFLVLLYSFFNLSSSTPAKNWYRLMNGQFEEMKTGNEQLDNETACFHVTLPNEGYYKKLDMYFMDEKYNERLWTRLGRNPNGVHRAPECKIDSCLQLIFNYEPSSGGQRDLVDVDQMILQRNFMFKYPDICNAKCDKFNEFIQHAPHGFKQLDRNDNGRVLTFFYCVPLFNNHDYSLTDEDKQRAQNSMIYAMDLLSKPIEQAAWKNGGDSKAEALTGNGTYTYRKRYTSGATSNNNAFLLTACLFVYFLLD